MLQFSVVLPAVHSLVQRVVSEGLWTGGLLRLLYEQSLCGIPALQACMERLGWHCQSTLCRYLHLWMVYGVLTDSRDQFFIVRRVGEGRGQEAGGAGKGAARAGEWSKDYSVRQVPNQRVPPGNRCLCLWVPTIRRVSHNYHKYYDVSVHRYCCI